MGIKVKMKALAAGPDGVTHPGQVTEVSLALAKVLVDGGHADYVERLETQPNLPKVETASLAPPEKAVKPPSQGKTAAPAPKKG